MKGERQGGREGGRERERERERERGGRGEIVLIKKQRNIEIFLFIPELVLFYLL